MSRHLAWNEARARVVDGVSPLPPDTVPTVDSRGRALAAAISARVDAPLRQLGDGRVRGAGGGRRRGLGVRPAAVGCWGAARRVRGAVRVGPGQAVRIMTGAPLPEGADAVVPVEDTNFWDGRRSGGACPPAPTRRRRCGCPPRLRPGGNVRRAGEATDRRDGSGGGPADGGAETGLLLPRGCAGPGPPVRWWGCSPPGTSWTPRGDPGPGQIPDSNRARSWPCSRPRLRDRGPGAGRGRRGGAPRASGTARSRTSS